MMKKLKWFIVIWSITMSVNNALAGEIEKGTVSVGAASNALFNIQDYSSDGYGDDSRGFNFSMEVGYFPLKNLEVGVEFWLNVNTDSYDSGKSYLLKPYVGYHWILNEKSNFYTRLGGGYGYSTNDNDHGIDMDSETTSFFAEIGYEYFLTQHISLGLGVLGEQIRRNLNYSMLIDDAITTSNNLSTQLKFKLYF